jgi:arylsulfate sulfotransferase
MWTAFRHHFLYACSIAACGVAWAVGCSRPSIPLPANPVEPLAQHQQLDKAVGDNLLIKPATVRNNPIERVPLVAIVDLVTKVPTTVQLVIADGQREWQQQVTKTGTDHSIAVLGMQPNLTHSIQVKVTSTDGRNEVVDQPLQFTTAKLPSDFPPLETVLSDPKQMEQGVRIFGVNLWNNAVSFLDYGYLIAVNEQGQVVWYCKTGDRTGDCKLLRNGHLIYQQGSYRFVYEIDLLGRDYRSWYAARSSEPPNPNAIAVDVDSIHHELIELPNGNFLTLGTELRRFQRFPSDEFNPPAEPKPAWVVCDEVVEFEPDTGQIVKRLPLTDMLDKDRFGYLSRSGFWKDKYDDFIDMPCCDWSHANSLQFVPEDQTIIVSLRHLDCILKIDWQTQRLLWILGDPSGWSKQFEPFLLSGVGELQWPYHQHSVTAIGSDKRLLMFDNGNYRAIPPQAITPAQHNSSRIVAYRIDPQRRTVQQIYSYGAEQGDKFYSPFYGQAQILPLTQNMLVADGGHIETAEGLPEDIVPGQRQWARIFEITGGSQPSKVFELKCASPLGSPLGWSIYRCNHFPSLHRDFRLDIPAAGALGLVQPRPEIKKRNPLEAYTPIVVE